MSKTTRWRRGLWAAGHWCSYALAWTIGFRAKKLQFEACQTVVLIILLLLSLSSAVINSDFEFSTRLSNSQPQKYYRVDRRSPSSSRHRPSVFTHTTHCFFNQLCSCKVLLRKSGYSDSTSVDDFGNVDYYDGFPVRDLVNGYSSLYNSIPTSKEESTEKYQGQFGTISTGSSVLFDKVASSTENINRYNATSYPSSSSTVSSEYLPQPSRLKARSRNIGRRRGKTRGSFLQRIGKDVQDVSCVGVPFTTIPGKITVSQIYVKKSLLDSIF